MKKKNLNQDEAGAIGDELDQLGKSQEQVDEDGISELEKAILDMENTDALGKSEEDEGADDLGKSEDDDNGEGADAGDDNGEDADDDLGKSDDDNGEGADADDDLGKSEDEFDFDGFEEELQKASEAYADLEGTVLEKSEQILSGQGDIAVAIATLTGLTCKLGKGLIALNKSVGIMAKQPAEASKILLASGDNKVDKELVKSIAEVRNTLTVMCQEEGVDARFLGILASSGIEGLKKALESHDETVAIEKLGL